MKKNFDALKAVRTVQGADKGGSRGNEGNVNPSNQDNDANTITGVDMNMGGSRTATGYDKAAVNNKGRDGGVGHDYTSHN